MPVARCLGLVFSTTECGIAAIGADAAEAYVKLPMRGATEWHGAPGFDLTHVPTMLAELLDQLRAAGWDLSRSGYLSQAWRQHDLVVVDHQGEPLLPALSWQANQGADLAERLNTIPGFRQAVGIVEARFVAAKLPWVWATAAAAGQPLAHTHRAMLSGDWLAARLTGNWRLSASDALCNGLLRQADKSLATAELREADQLLGGGLDPALFPPVIASDGVVGTVDTTAPGATPGGGPWRKLAAALEGWQVAAALGDNQASAAGCGAAEHDTVVVSLGTSGTVNHPVPPPTAAPPDDSDDTDADSTASIAPAPAILGFEYWQDRLRLLMLPDCAAWYEGFLRDSGIAATAAAAPAPDHAALNRLAAEGVADAIRLADGLPSPQLAALPAPAQVASTQTSIALEMLRLLRHMIATAEQPVTRVVLTGGLSRAPLIRAVLQAGVRAILGDGATTLQNARGGDLAFKTDALGALINADAAATGQPVNRTIAAHRQWLPCPTVDPALLPHVERMVTDELSR